jgi:hypothetical protein
MFTIDKVSNILRIYHAATEEEKNSGLSWYLEAREYSKELSEKYSIRFEVAAAVLAALSPLNYWNRNKVDAENTIKFHRGLGGYPRSTTPKRNIEKALKILKTGKILKYLSGDKVTRFFENIINPNSNRVTVDRHAIAIALNDRSIKSIPARYYGDFETAYKQAAKIVGLRPNRLQAVTWVVWRTRDFNQLTLF